MCALMLLPTPPPSSQTHIRSHLPGTIESHARPSRSACPASESSDESEFCIAAARAAAAASPQLSPLAPAPPDMFCCPYLIPPPEAKIDGWYQAEPPVANER